MLPWQPFYNSRSLFCSQQKWKGEQIEPAKGVDSAAGPNPPFSGLILFHWSMWTWVNNISGTGSSGPHSQAWACPREENKCSLTGGGEASQDQNSPVGFSRYHVGTTTWPCWEFIRISCKSLVHPSQCHLLYSDGEQLSKISGGSLFQTSQKIFFN